MSVLIISFIPYTDQQIYAGVPQYLEMTSNTPATIYYTTDGTTPTINSPIYISPITMPVEDVVIVSAFGVDGLGNQGSIVSQVFGPFYYNTHSGQGIVVDGPIIPQPQKIIDGYDYDTPVRFLDIPRTDLELAYSYVGYDGEGLGNAIDVGETDTAEQEPGLIEDSWQAIGTTESAQFFNPYARTIVMDGRKNNEVNWLNRPHGSFMNDKLYNYGAQYRVHGLSDNYISGGFTRHFYNIQTQTLVSYYRDLNSMRQIKSIEPYEINVSNLKGPSGQIMYGMPLVFSWIPRGRQQSAHS